MQFLQANYTYIVAVIVVLGGLFLAGRKNAKKTVLAILYDSKEFLVKELGTDEAKYVEFIYSHIPASTKAFLTKTVVSGIVSEFVAVIAKGITK